MQPLNVQSTAKFTDCVFSFLAKQLNSGIVVDSRNLTEISWWTGIYGMYAIHQLWPEFNCLHRKLTMESVIYHGCLYVDLFIISPSAAKLQRSPMIQLELKQGWTWFKYQVTILFLTFLKKSGDTLSLLTTRFISFKLQCV